MKHQKKIEMALFILLLFILCGATALVTMCATYIKFIKFI